jgi:Bifunctional DNA primase/polymerase, N-terminal
VDHLAAALGYALAGVYVLPLAPRSKVPVIPARNGGHGLHDATTDPDVIRSWWQVHPTANLGLRTGLGFDVIDLDSEAAIGCPWLSRLNH